MQKNDTIPQYLSKFTQCHDELGGVDVTVPEEDLVSLTLLGLPKSWHSYPDSVNGKDKILNWERLWTDFVQEETRQNSGDGTSSKGEDEEKFSLDGKAKKGKGKKYQSKPESNQGGKNKYLSKIKCFHCHEFMHYATKCAHKKASRKTSGGVVGEALASQSELEFMLIACMTNIVIGSLWYLDSDAHQDGGDERYNVTDIGTITFQRELSFPLMLMDFMYILGLKKNLVSIAVLEDRGYDAFFNKGKSFLRHIAWDR
eukprot:PITA_03716